MLSMSALNQILEVDVERHTITVQAGIQVKQVAAGIGGRVMRTWEGGLFTNPICFTTPHRDSTPHRDLGGGGWLPYNTMGTQQLSIYPISLLPPLPRKTRTLPCCTLGACVLFALDLPIPTFSVALTGSRCHILPQMSIKVTCPTTVSWAPIFLWPY